jgi:hypothetical protein
MCWAPYIALLTLALMTVGCDGTDPGASVSVAGQTLAISEPSEPCYPVGTSVCQDRGLTNEETWSIESWVSYFYQNSQNIQQCADIIQRAYDRLYTGNIRFWSSGSNVDSYDGDAHYTIGLIHLTSNAFGTYENLARTVFHESAHLLGLNHTTTAFYEDMCM